MTNPADLSLTEASNLIGSRKLSPVELTNACLDRIERYDGQLASFVTICGDRARAEARAAETEILAARYRGPMHGIPYCLKDIIDVAGIRTTAQSRSLEYNIPTEDSACQSRLAAAGAILLGKNATYEFAHGGPSWDVLFPPARNPWNLDFSPSGSSSGSAAAVAARFTPAAIGTDTGGSIRAPAAACGVTGLKPTYGLVSRRGVIPNSWSQDHVGLLARTAEDAAIVLNTIAGYDRRDAASVDIGVKPFRLAPGERLDGLILGVPMAWLDEVPPGLVTKSAFEVALAVLRGLGVEVREVVLPPLLAYNDAKRVIAAAEMFAYHSKQLHTRADWYGASFRYRVLAGASIRAEDYITALRRRAELARDLQISLQDVHGLLLPTGEPAQKLVPLSPESLFTRSSYTAPANLAGNPAIAICCGFTEYGMPLSIQIIGRLFDEATLLRMTIAYQRATAWHEQKPALSHIPPDMRPSRNSSVIQRNRPEI